MNNPLVDLTNPDTTVLPEGISNKLPETIQGFPPLLKYFIDGTIRYREWCVVTEEVGEQVFLLDKNEEHYHFEFYEAQDKKLCQIWHKRDWLQSIERREIIQKQSEAERAERFAREEAFINAKRKLMNKKINPLSEKEADEVIGMCMRNAEGFETLKIALGLDKVTA